MNIRNETAQLALGDEGVFCVPSREERKTYKKRRDILKEDYLLDIATEQDGNYLVKTYDPWRMHGAMVKLNLGHLFDKRTSYDLKKEILLWVLTDSNAPFNFQDCLTAYQQRELANNPEYEWVHIDDFREEIIGTFRRFFEPPRKLFLAYEQGLLTHHFDEERYVPLKMQSHKASGKTVFRDGL